MDERRDQLNVRLRPIDRKAIEAIKRIACVTDNSNATRLALHDYGQRLVRREAAHRLKIQAAWLDKRRTQP